MATGRLGVGCMYRFVEKNRRDVEEKSEQLKAISNLAALFAGFAVVTLTQFNFNYTDNPIVSSDLTPFSAAVLSAAACPGKAIHEISGTNQLPLEAGRAAGMMHLQNRHGKTAYCEPGEAVGWPGVWDIRM